MLEFFSIFRLQRDALDMRGVRQQAELVKVVDGPRSRAQGLGDRSSLLQAEVYVFGNFGHKLGELFVRGHDAERHDALPA